MGIFDIIITIRLKVVLHYMLCISAQVSKVKTYIQWHQLSTS